MLAMEELKLVLSFNRWVKGLPVLGRVIRRRMKVGLSSILGLALQLFLILGEPSKKSGRFLKCEIIGVELPKPLLLRNWLVSLLDVEISLRGCARLWSSKPSSSENPMVKSESELFILDLLGESPEDLLLLRSLVIGRATKAKNDIT